MELNEASPSPTADSSVSGVKRNWWKVATISLVSIFAAAAIGVAAFRAGQGSGPRATDVQVPQTQPTQPQLTQPPTTAPPSSTAVTDSNNDGLLTQEEHDLNQQRLSSEGAPITVVNLAFSSARSMGQAFCGSARESGLPAQQGIDKFRQDELARRPADQKEDVEWFVRAIVLTTRSMCSDLL